MARALFLTSGGHAKLGSSRVILEDVLSRQAGLDLNVRDDHIELTPGRLRDYDLIVDYSGHAPKEPNDDQLNALMAAVEGGTPYIGLHVASLPFKSQLDYRKRHGAWPESPQPDDLLNPTQIRYFEMIGSAFITHGPIEIYTVNVLDADHPITRGVESFDVIDELYQLGGNRSRLHVLAESGGNALLYTQMWGKGKVHYNSLAHDGRTLGHPGYQRLLRQAVDWALG